MFAGLTKAKKLSKAKKLFWETTSDDAKWQRMALDDFNFRNGHQWSSDERQQMEEDKRPALTFNLIKSQIDVLLGINDENRVSYKATPVENSDGPLADIINDIDDWIVEVNDIQDIEDSAFESALICGRGFVGIDFAPNPDKFGEIILTEVDIPVHQVHFDPAARQPLFDDARWVFWERWMSKEDFRVHFPKISPKKIDSIIDNKDNITPQMVGEPQDAFDNPEVDDNNVALDYTKEIDYPVIMEYGDTVRVIHMEYWQAYKRYFAFNPETGTFEEIEKPTKETKEAYKQTFGEEMVVETLMDKQVMWLQFAGDEILYDGPSPMPFKGFSIIPIIAYTDSSKRTQDCFGVTRMIKDPQMEINKRWSQTLNLLNNQIMPGVFAEADAFVDNDQAEQSMREVMGVTYVTPGALTSGKIKERSVPAFPSASMQMEQFAQGILSKISGVNPDLLGHAGTRQEPGIVVKMRQQQGLTLLRTLFRNYNQAKKELFKRRVSIILAYMPDSQIIRILGPKDKYQVDPRTRTIVDTETGEQINIHNVREVEYDIVARETDGNTSRKMLELAVLLEMSQRFPVPPEQIITKLDISDKEKKKWLLYIQQQQEAQSKAQEEAMQAEMQLKQGDLMIKAQKNKFDFMVDLAKIKQMAEKDEKKLVTSFAQMDQNKQAQVLDFALKAAQIISQETKKELGENGKT